MRCRSLNVYYTVRNFYLELKIDGIIFLIAAARACFKLTLLLFHSSYSLYIFQCHNSSGHNMALGSTRPPTEMSKDKGHPATGRGGPRGSG
jgi:hypothetical protein